MNKKYIKILEGEFKELSYKNFKINKKIYHNIFVCGGKVNENTTFRNNFCCYTKKINIHDSIVLAEEFTDYKDKYPDLITFENEIANISSLILIFLEATGSYVELGLFCKKNYCKKLIIVNPSTNQERNSFIYSGAIQYIKNNNKENEDPILYQALEKEKDKDKCFYHEDDIKILIDLINKKLKLNSKIEFDKNNTGHIAFLIYEIVDLSYPILLNEIQSIIKNLLESDIKKIIERQLYLLEKFSLIKIFSYNKSNYYYTTKKNKLDIVKFGKSKNNIIIDKKNIQLSIIASIEDSDNENEIRNVKRIREKIEEEKRKEDEKEGNQQ